MMSSSSFSVSGKNSGRRGDTWDPETLSSEQGSGDTGGFTSKLSSKMSQQFETIKVAAFTGFRRIKESEKLDKIMVLSSKGVEKVKDGACYGFQWIKDKCRKTAAHNSRVIIV